MAEHMTLRKLRNRYLIPVRYRGEDCVQHGWVEYELPNGGLVIRLVGEERPRRLSAGEARRWVTILDYTGKPAPKGWKPEEQRASTGIRNDRQQGG